LGATSLIWWALRWCREPLPFENFLVSPDFKIIKRSLIKNKIKILLYAGCISFSPIKPSFELERSVTAMLKEKYF
jgi:hypothetical protein